MNLYAPNNRGIQNDCSLTSLCDWSGLVPWSQSSKQIGTVLNATLKLLRSWVDGLEVGEGLNISMTWTTWADSHTTQCCSRTYVEHFRQRWWQLTVAVGVDNIIIIWWQNYYSFGVLWRLCIFDYYNIHWYYVKFEQD